MHHRDERTKTSEPLPFGSAVLRVSSGHSSEHFLKNLLKEGRGEATT
jgi:hypothetical protein